MLEVASLGGNNVDEKSYQSLAKALRVATCTSSSCCSDHLDAARAGHTQCLQGLAEAGRFLPLGSPDRASAGEFRRLEVWQAAITTCSAGHRPTLSWLFSSGWPSSIDAALPWHMRDIVDLRQVMERHDLAEKDSLISEVCYGEKIFLLELDLYRHAMRKATPECLEALLEAGCRSEWICPAAALEGNAAFLDLAAKWGCPCNLVALEIAAWSGDVPLLEIAHSAALRRNGALFSRMGNLDDFQKKGISYVALLAALGGHAACLGALLGWYGRSSVCIQLAESMAIMGHLNCLQTLQRAGCLDMEEAAIGAACGAQVECLKYLLDLDPGLVHLPLLTSAARKSEAKPEAQVACLEFLQHRGCQWSANGEELAVSADRPEVLRYCLERVRVRPWGRAMCFSIESGSVECMQLLYNAGHRPPKASCHPAVYVVKKEFSLSRHAARACWLLAVSRSGVPDAQLLHMVLLEHYTMWGGEDMLRYVRELGAPFSIETTNSAARKGNVGALRYALKNGAPWDATTFEAVLTPSSTPYGVHAEICPDWLECLRCLHEHARAAGFPVECRRPPERAFPGRLFDGQFSPAGTTLAVLRYVCDHMGPAWATPLLESTAVKLEVLVPVDDRVESDLVNWQMVLYLGRKLKQGLRAPLGELVAVRRERAAALAGVFFKAGRLAQGRDHPRLLALWGALARLPSDLRERIAFEAHLIYSEAPWQPKAS